MLTQATGTGKTIIAFQLAWKLLQSRWSLSGEPTRRPRILFLANRNTLADQAYIAVSALPDDALVRIEPADIKKKGNVPKNGINDGFLTPFKVKQIQTTLDQYVYMPDDKLVEGEAGKRCEEKVRWASSCDGKGNSTRRLLWRRVECAGLWDAIIDRGCWSCSAC